MKRKRKRRPKPRLWGGAPSWRLWWWLINTDRLALGWVIYPDIPGAERLAGSRALWERWQRMTPNRRRRARRAFIKRHEKEVLLWTLSE